MSTASRSALATITMVNPAVVFADLDGEVVLLNTETGVYFGLEGAGALIWAMLPRERSSSACWTASRSSRSGRGPIWLPSSTNC
jgi:hypothetical protein